MLKQPIEFAPYRIKCIKIILSPTQPRELIFGFNYL